MNVESVFSSDQDGVIGIDLISFRNNAHIGCEEADGHATAVAVGVIGVRAVNQHAVVQRHLARFQIHRHPGGGIEAVFIDRLVDPKQIALLLALAVFE